MEQNQSAAPIRDLQRMLDQLSQRNDRLPRLVPTGNFDEPTLEAVMIFQRDTGLPVTGVVDHDSWYAIVRAYQDDLLHYGEPAVLRVLPNGSFRTEPGQASEPVRLAQALFCALSVPVANFDLCQGDRVNQGSTQQNLRRVQHLAGLEQTGALDRATWEYLARLYHLYVTRSIEPSGAGRAAMP